MDCAAGEGRVYTWSVNGAATMGCWWLWQWASRALPFLPFHYSPQSALGRFLLFAVYIAPPLWCQSDTLFLDLLPLGEHAADW